MFFCQYRRNPFAIEVLILKIQISFKTMLMKAKSTIVTFTRSFVSILLLFISINATSQVSSITEGFEGITSDDPTPVPGWTGVNNSTGNATAYGWLSNLDYDPATFPFEPHQGSECLIGSFENTDGDATATISNWIITPLLKLENGAIIKFWTTTEAGSDYPDRLEVRLSTAGTSVNVGATPTSVGDFSGLLLSVNPNLTVGGYPEVWTEYTITLSGLPPAGTNGRVALRYFVTNGGFEGDNSYLIGIDQFSYATPSTQPVKLTTFTGERYGMANKLKWSTATESSNLGFEAERSSDGLQFSKIGFTASKASQGNSSQKLDYQFIDEHPFAKTNFYRLKQVDHNGKVAYSSVVMVNGAGRVASGIISIYPNPVKNRLNLTLASSSAGTANIIVSDISGKVMLQKVVQATEGNQNFSLNVAGYASGIYLVKISTNKDDVISTMKFVKE
jgi:hypothetical protein